MSACTTPDGHGCYSCKLHVTYGNNALSSIYDRQQSTENFSFVSNVVFFTHSSHPGNSIQVYLSIYDDSVTSEALSFTCVMAVGCIWEKEFF